jgi:hypothetical protein
MDNKDTLEHYRWCCQENLETLAEKDTKKEREREGQRERERERERERVDFRTEA